MRNARMIAAAAVAFGALVAPSIALPQALTLDTSGQVDGAQVVEPVMMSVDDDDTSAAVTAGRGKGRAVTAGGGTSEPAGQTTLGCVDAAGATGDLAASAGVGDCGSAAAGSSGGSVGAGGGSVSGGGLAGDAGIGCIEVGFGGGRFGDIQFGACDGARSRTGAEGSGGSGDPCVGFSQLAGGSGSGTSPWLLAAGALAVFLIGAVSAQWRRDLSLGAGGF